MKIKYLLLSLLSFIIFPLKTWAVCPVCTVAVGLGVGLSRYLGIDDSITGIWIGALLSSVSYWTINWLDKKKIQFIGRKILVIILYFGSTYFSLWYSDIIYHPWNTLWSIDKLILGIFLGTFLFIMSNITYEYLKKRNNNHAWFPYQKVVMPIVLLTLISIIFYFITR